MDRLVELMSSILGAEVSDRTAAQFGAVALGIFTFMLVISIAILAARIVRYRRRRMKVPSLAKRDFWFLAGLALPFLGIFVARAFGIRGLGTNLLWLIATTVLALLAMGVWLWYGVFIIERTDEERRE